MRRISIGLTFLLALALTSCGGDDPATVFADMQWAVRCGEFGMCSGLPDRDICGLDGGSSDCNMPPNPARYDIRCGARTVSGNLNFSIRAYNRVDPEDVYGITINNLVVAPGGGMPLGGDCELIVEEGGNTFVGTCGASSSTGDAQPCYISPLSIRDEPEGPTVEFTVMCTDLPNEADITRKRELTGPVSATMAAPIRLVSCSGI